jgi:hypothetical protein
MLFASLASKLEDRMSLDSLNVIFAMFCEADAAAQGIFTGELRLTEGR